MSLTIRDLFTTEEWELLTQNKDLALAQIGDLPLPEESEDEEDDA